MSATRRVFAAPSTKVAAFVLFVVLILTITGGLLAVILGLMFFMEGLKLGLMPFGTVIGATLPRKSSLPVVLIITLLLGIGVTFAAPATGASATLSSATAATDAAGHASVSAVANATVGSYTVTASVAGVATPASCVAASTMTIFCSATSPQRAHASRDARS